MKLKRIFSVVLTMALLASLLAVPAFAENKDLILREDWRLTGELDLNVPEGTTLTIKGSGFHIYEFGAGQLKNSGLGKVVFSEGTVLYPKGTSGTCDTASSNKLMMERQPHKVTVNSMENGTVTTSATDEKAKKDDNITLTVTPDEGYQLNSLTYTATEIGGSAMTITANEGTYSFTMPASDVTISATFTAKGTPAAPAAPTFSPAGGTYTSAQNVTITAVDGATIYYTTDGSAPTASSTQYTAPITISSTTTLKAVAVMGDVYSDVTSATYTISTGGGGGGGGGGGSSSSTTTETTTNADGSTTTTVTNKTTGTVTETTKFPDGSTEVVETKKDGTVTTTSTDKAGSKTAVVENPDGSSQTTVTNKDGSSSVTAVSEDGRVEAEVKLPSAVVSAAEESGEAVALPMPALPAADDVSSAPAVTVDLPAGTRARVEIPVEKVTAGTVAVLVNEDGTETIMKTTLATENGVAVSLADGDTVKIVDNSKTFADVPDSYWGADEIAFAASRELFQGTSATTFSPDTPMNRAMIVTVLARLEGVDTDTGANWYDAGAAWAVESGISDGSNMDGTLTREQLATMLYRYAQSKGLGFTGMWAFQLDYTDADAVSNYAYEAMCWATMHGIINGVGENRLDPQGQATRAQVAAMLMRFISVTA